MNNNKKIGLALGGGGARCFTHLGIIEVLQQNNIQIDCIAGSSMGSIIAALIADEIPIKKIKEEFYRKIRRISWFKPIFSKSGFVSQSNIKKLLKNLLTKENLKDLKIALNIVATDLNGAKLKVFKKEENIIDTVCASCAFPGIYPPIKIKNKIYVDGGILDNIPADICKKELGENSIVISSVLEGSFTRIDDKIGNMFGIVWRSIYIPLIKAREKNVKENSDLILRPLKDIEFNFHNWKDILRFYNVKLMESYYQKGKKEMEKKIPTLNKLLNKK